MRTKQKDMIGMVLGKLTVIGVVRGENGRSKCLCRCACGKEKLVYYANMVKRKRSKSTKCCGSPECRRKLNTTARLLYQNYRSRARRKGLVFVLNLDAFIAITQQKCHYCGQKPSNVRKGRHCNLDYTYNGIDRKDNEKGYEEGNMLPCCWRCNDFKGIESYDVFVSNIKEIYKFITGGGM